MHSKNFEKIKKFYEDELWSKAKVKAVVGKVYGITADEYEEIVGEPYEP